MICGASSEKGLCRVVNWESVDPLHYCPSLLESGED